MGAARNILGGDDVMIGQDDLLPRLLGLVHGALLGLAIRCKLDAAYRSGVGQRGVYLTSLLAVLLYSHRHRDRRYRFAARGKHWRGSAASRGPVPPVRHRLGVASRPRGLLKRGAGGEVVRQF